MDERITVLEVIEATTAGTKKHVLSLVKALDRAQFSVAVACPRVRSPAYGDISFVEELERLEGISVFLVEMRRDIQPFSDTKALVSLYRVIREGRYHIVHTHSSKAGALGRLAAKWAGIPVILYTPHGFAFRTVRNGLIRWAYVQVERLCGLWTDRIICVSPTEREEALKNRIARPNKLVVIENGLDLGEFVLPLDHLAKKRQLGLDSHNPIVGTMGRLSWDKDFHCFLEAAVRVSTAYPETQFLVVGDGEARKDLELLATDLGISRRTVFTGFRPDSLEILALMDIFVLPSPHEAMPYTILEAMASEKPVLAIEGTGAQDVLQPGETGLLVPPQDPKTLAMAIMALLRDKARARAMGLAGREVVESRFTLAHMVRRTEELYTTLLETKPALSIVSSRGMAW
jgi:glycosyltransferase involved in cell wall biosynthesis